MKEAYYFSHDSNSRNDGKILNLRIKHGMRGYGIFWSIIEMLRDESNYKMRMECERIAFELHEDSELIRSVLQDFDLFIIEDGFLWSESLLRRMQMKDEKSNKARESALKRWNKPVESERNANALQTQSDGNASKVKERKVKENNKMPVIVDLSKNEQEKITDKIFIELSKSNIWLEQTSMYYKTDPNLVIEHLRKFYHHCKLTDNFKSETKEAKIHFKNWVEKGNPIPQPKIKSNFEGW